MDPRFLRFYQDELQFIREHAGEFAREFPKIAGRLALDPDGKEICPDPFVERLLEGFAFLTARIQLKYDSEYPRFTQAFFDTLLPQYLAPLPSMAVLRFEPDLGEGALAEGFPIPAGTVLRSNIGKDERTACEFRTGQAMTLWPLRIGEVRYLTRDAATLNLPAAQGHRSIIQLRLQTTAGLKFSDLSLDHLDIYIRGGESLANRIGEQLFARTRRVVGRPGEQRKGSGTDLPRGAIRRLGLSSEEALLPHCPRTHEGFRLLREYFAFPAKFHFFRIANLAPLIKACPGTTLDLFFCADAADPLLEGQLDASILELFCVPAINLVSKRMDRINLERKASEYHLVVDKTRSLDYEVYRPERVVGIGVRTDEEVDFRPFYFSSRKYDGESYYTLRRSPRLLTASERRFGKVSRYTGSEVFLSLVTPDGKPGQTDLRQLSISGLCTNRHLPLTLSVGAGRSDFYLDSGGPIEAIRCISGPTTPAPSPVEGEFIWRLVSHLSLNHYSLADTENGSGVAALRELIQLYLKSDSPGADAQVQGIRSVGNRTVVRRLDVPGPIAFGRGQEVTVEFDESLYEGSGVFFLGSILERFFAQYVSINSFSETVIRSQQRGELIRWPLQTGRKPIL